MSTAEAETLVTAQTEGKLQLTLRNPLNAEKQIATVAPAAPVMAVATATEPRRVVPRGNGESGRAVTVIRGTEAKVVNIR
ncbi:hypothetical protein D3C84_1000860 [compost metagenome]